MFPFGIDELQGVPIAFEHVDKKELDARIADTHRSCRPFVIVFPVEEIVLKFLLGDFIRSFSVKIDQLSN